MDPDGNPTGDIHFEESTVLPYFMVFHTVDAADPFTHYHARLSITGAPTPSFVGDPIAFTTLADESITTPYTVKWALGSCQAFGANGDIPFSGGEQIQLAWDDLQQFEPDILWDVGDFHYLGGQPRHHDNGDPTLWSTWASMYWLQLSLLSTMRRVRSLVVEDQVSDDHEFSANNGESCIPGLNTDPEPYAGVDRAVQGGATTKIFAMYDPADVIDSSPILYGSYMLTPRIRVIILDDESSQRSYGLLSDTSSKVFIGETQYGWLQELLLDRVTLNLIIAGKSYLTPSIPAGQPIAFEDSDKVWAYGAWRQDFADWLLGVNQESGERPVNIVWMGGDRHVVAFDDGSRNDWGGFPCLIGSGWAEFTLPQRVDETYGYAYPWTAGDDPAFVMQYTRGSLVDTGLGVRLSVHLRYIDNAGSDPPWNWVTHDFPTCFWPYVD